MVETTAKMLKSSRTKRLFFNFSDMFPSVSVTAMKTSVELCSARVTMQTLHYFTYAL